MNEGKVKGMGGKEGLRIARLLMVLSSFSPLFILWALRGTGAVADPVLIPLCIALVVLPNAVLWLRIMIARKRDDTSSLVPSKVSDQKEHIIVYLFAMLVPLYDANIGTLRDFAAVGVAFAFIVFVFWKLNLHYVNLIFALFGYNVFTLTVLRSSGQGQPHEATVVVLSRKGMLLADCQINAYRISDSVYLEKEGRNVA